MIWVVILLSVFFVLLEGGVSSLPLLLVLFLCALIVRRVWWIFPLAVLSGILLDVMQLRNLGETSLFFVVFLLLISLYERKYETNSLVFVGVSSFFGSLVYLVLFGYHAVVLQSIISCLLAAVLFLCLHIWESKHPQIHRV
jgi:hypothetical protein